ncbi:hypothetical protein KIV40_34665, partial [Vibrio sp. D173a]|nr:hypothetical protein [Vibrio sp. D173a]
QVLGTIAGIVVAVGGAFIVYGILNKVTGLRLSEEDEFNGADLAIHKISSVSEDQVFIRIIFLLIPNLKSDLGRFFICHQRKQSTHCFSHHSLSSPKLKPVHK